MRYWLWAAVLLMAAERLCRPTAAAEPAPPSEAPKYYVFQVQVIEVDSTGKQTVVATPRIQTPGATAGVTVEGPAGRRYDFSVGVRDKGDPLLAGSADAPAGPALLPPPAGAAPRGPASPAPSGPDLASSAAALPPLAPPPGPFPAVTHKPIVPAPPVASIGERLQKSISVKAVNQTRRDLLKQIGREAGVNIVIDPEIAAAIRPVLDAPIQYAADNQPAREVLRQLIEPMRLAYAVRHEVVLIGHAERMKPRPEDFSVRNYPVPEAFALPDGGADFDKLIAEIKANVLAGTWEGEPPAASIRAFTSTRSLLVRQTDEGHDAIKSYLRKYEQ